ncbi:hypothetical protein SERLA73DRAFT_182482 [Serpula lacrymans var. lacrymans S7.3]|uniref:Uncharacterized protein n=2 Tax=Serpula lacrymans var. lacrymans TaxID=341189 RepID=F8PXH8_SERL3|nr:uncharacterized protein SERLADRAFT_469153 [Serpula lacrymans var. lacrymans S7.9]EGN99504.1 hypothetical protein SERLA73DRAFT_182482 [Serpula lacrymans var. lacrymans S7.3]EGO25058.1 hypothetical protein SERLADRAFT_469153 [Serpula lacrymans var. lacrymans S7.9]
MTSRQGWGLLMLRRNGRMGLGRSCPRRVMACLIGLASRCNVFDLRGAILNRDDRILGGWWTILKVKVLQGWETKVVVHVGRWWKRIPSMVCWMMGRGHRCNSG